jgi:hypothetical protein
MRGAFAICVFLILLIAGLHAHTHLETLEKKIGID